jgi:hypothetical protein
VLLSFFLALCISIYSFISLNFKINGKEDKMFRYKSHKQAFIMTALVILLCLVCLTGATLALFTSGATDGTIGIVTTSGDVEVDIVDTAGNSLQNKALSFVTLSGTTSSENVFFEPGVTFYTQSFKIKNKGNIPVNFRLSVGKDDIVEIVGGNKQKVDLTAFFNTFDIYILEEGQPISSATGMKEFKVENLKPQHSSKTYFLFIKMKETIGNEFQGKKYSGIGITVYAVQGNANIN